MPNLEGITTPKRESGTLKLVGERRATDRLVRLWKTAQDKPSMFGSVSTSNLWDHCFLFVMDDEANSSVIIDQGESAAKGLFIRGRGTKTLNELPPALARRIHRLGLECRKDRAPKMDACEFGEEKDIPVRRYRMALVPLTRPKSVNSTRKISTLNMLGVFTYQ